MAKVTENLQGVEIGFLLAQKAVLEMIPKHGNPSFERTVFPQLIAANQFAAFPTEHRYYSVGKVARLPLTKQFLARHPTILLDRDGVLNKKAPKACYIEKWSDWEWLPGALQAIALLRKAGYRLLIISNQAGIARGKMTEEDLTDIHKHMLEDIRSVGGDIDKIYY